MFNFNKLTQMAVYIQIQLVYIGSLPKVHKLRVCVPPPPPTFWHLPTPLVCVCVCVRGVNGLQICTGLRAYDTILTDNYDFAEIIFFSDLHEIFQNGAEFYRASLT